jgi:hypothetical protein
MSKTALAMSFEKWRPSFEVRKYLVRKYQRCWFEKVLQVIANDRRAVLSVYMTSKIMDFTPGRRYEHINVKLGEVFHTFEPMDEVVNERKGIVRATLAG